MACHVGTGEGHSIMRCKLSSYSRVIMTCRLIVVSEGYGISIVLNEK